jgi:hypothetical protein
MSATRLYRTAAIAVLACLALSGPAAAVPADNGRHSESTGALAQEQYYSSYATPEPLDVAPSPAPSNDTPWLAIALSAAALLAIAAAVVAILLRRHRVRRHAPQVA